MKAWVKRASGLQFEDVPSPTPDSDELLIGVKAISLNRGELRSVMRAGDGVTPGWDVAGTVIASAPNGKGPTKGSRVAALLAGGGWAEVVKVSIEQAAVVPESVDIAVAAALPIAGLTVVRALQVSGSLLGKTMLVTGAAGGVGQLALQIGNMSGAIVTGVSSRRAEWAHLRELGAREIVATVDDAAGPFDFVLESVGGRTFAIAMERLANGGGIVTIGNSSEEETAFNVRTLYGKGGAWIYGLLIFDEVQSRRVDGRDLERILSLVQNGQLKTSITLRSTWRELPAVLEALERRTYSGKAVLTVE